MSTFLPIQKKLWGDPPPKGVEGQKGNMFKYEITFILPEAQTKEPVSKIIESVGGKIISSKDLGAKAFVYPIAKATIGRYFNVLFEIEPADLKKLEKPLKLERSILRYLLIKALRFRAPRPPRELKKDVKDVKKEITTKPSEEKKAVEEPKTEEKKAEPKIEKVEKGPSPVRERAKEAPKKEKPKAPEIEKGLLDEKLKDLVED